MKPKTKAVATTAMFLAVLTGLSVANWLWPEKDFSENENRSLQTLPEFSAEKLFSGKYTSQFETYTTDQFIGRDYWVSMKTSADRVTQKKDSGGVYFAEDGYLIEVYREEDVDWEQFQRNVDRLNEFLTSAEQTLGQGHASAMIVPTAGEVLRDKLPAFAPSADQKKMLEQMENTLPAGSFVNLLPVLSEHKEDSIYYHTDHHWTTYGAFLAYQQWAESMGITPLSQEDYEIKTVTESFYGTTYSKANDLGAKPDSIQVYLPKETQSVTLEINSGKETQEFNSLYVDSYLEKKDKYSYFLGGNNPVDTIHTGVNNGRKLLIVKDSYAHCFAPFLTSHFEEITLVDLRYFRKGMKEYMEENGFTDVLVLYNLQGFADDKNMGTLVK
ncbi:MAG: DHHW family protein [Massiliimalia sp.]|jgi:hypothetical protein